MKEIKDIGSTFVFNSIPNCGLHGTVETILVLQYQHAPFCISNKSNMDLM